MHIPDFIGRQFYVEGSLRNRVDGFELQAQNPLGAGTLVGIGTLRVDGREVDTAALTAQREGDEEVISAAEVSAYNPIRVAKGDRVTLRVAGERLAPGDHLLQVELYEVNLGLLSFALSDRIADSG
jgi:hypothetical protein